MPVTEVSKAQLYFYALVRSLTLHGYNIVLIIELK